jgi:hypothetical protein
VTDEMRPLRRRHGDEVQARRISGHGASARLKSQNIATESNDIGFLGLGGASAAGYCIHFATIVLLSAGPVATSVAIGPISPTNRCELEAAKGFSDTN